ncbi:MAG: hypothetical protein R2909_19000 [Gemmatimonadales bacterium]
MSTQPSIRRIATALLLLFVAGCGAERPLEPTPIETGPNPDALLGGGLIRDVVSAVDPVLDPVRRLLHGLLSCSAERPVSATETIGPRGGVLELGRHRLVVPAGALDAPVRIRGEVVSGDVNSVRFYPHGLQFERPAQLVMGYGNCELVDTPKLIVYTTEDLRVIEVLPSVDRARREVSAPLDHFSRYAVAW